MYTRFRLLKIACILSGSYTKGPQYLFYLKVMLSWVPSNRQCNSLGFGNSRFWSLTGWRLCLPLWISISSLANERVGTFRQCFLNLHIFIKLLSIFIRAVVCHNFLCKLALSQSVMWKPGAGNQKQTIYFCSPNESYSLQVDCQTPLNSKFPEWL